jgi:hypothetical protein
MSLTGYLVTISCETIMNNNGQGTIDQIKQQYVASGNQWSRKRNNVCVDLVLSRIIAAADTYVRGYNFNHETTDTVPPLATFS